MKMLDLSYYDKIRSPNGFIFDNYGRIVHTKIDDVGKIPLKELYNEIELILKIIGEKNE